jgi:hypothetical protein
VKASAWQELRAGDRTVNSTFCGRCRFQMEAGEGVYTRDDGRIGARHAGDCPPPLTVREIAGAAAVGPRSKEVRVDDLTAMTELRDMPGSEAVLAVLASHLLNRMPPGFRKNRCGVVARALLKAMSTARLSPVATLRIRGYTPWQVCKLVERISRDCPESELGMMCDVWICRSHESL